MRPLTFILLLIFLSVVYSVAGAITITGPRTIEFSEDETVTCNKEGGCRVITNDAFDALTGKVEELRRLLKEEKSKICV